MIPKNEQQTPAKELSWRDRMQLTLESLYDTEAVRNPNQVVQETSAYFEKQMSTVGTNMRKFCAEFMKEVLLPETTRKLEGSPVDPLQAEVELNNGVLSGIGKPIKSAKVLDADDVVFHPQASISGSALEDIPLDHIADVQHDQEASREGVPAVEATEPAVVENSPVLPKDEQYEVDEQDLQQSLPEGGDDQQAHWFVNEEYRALKLGELTSSSSLPSCYGMQTTRSSDSLSDWELV